MQKLKNNKVYFVLMIIALVLVLSITAGSLYAYSRNTTLIGLFTGKTNDGGTVNRVATYDIQIDGKPENKIDFTAYATAKISDIEETDDGYKGHSFLEDAYQKHTIKITNNSEVRVRCNLTMETTTNDKRVFAVVLPDISYGENDIETEILEALYTDADLSTIDKVRDFIDSISVAYEDVGLGPGKSCTYTMLVWSEHDAVYPDNDGDGVADEAGKKLSELKDGIPSESYTLNYTFTQDD